jgi:hypothetical protein
VSTNKPSTASSLPPIQNSLVSARAANIEHQRSKTRKQVTNAFSAAVRIETRLPGTPLYESALAIERASVHVTPTGTRRYATPSNKLAEEHDNNQLAAKRTSFTCRGTKHHADGALKLNYEASQKLTIEIVP